ncbi:hypothetical protein [Rhizobium mongolense]|uniref:Uncharacterized protein n=1 Tax=Rhizobium mongolense TaxID=57676 RepID=A0A7W6RU00_9HYPH|nr:hypothetical protein [Rhizobium mongolense]MBB4278548.1 hypothetical protein [Rhizobium mongolense]
MLLKYEVCRMARPNCRSRATVGVLGCIRRSVIGAMTLYRPDVPERRTFEPSSVELVDGDHGESSKIMSVPDREVTDWAAIP